MGENIGSKQTSANFIGSKLTTAKLIGGLEHAAIITGAILSVAGLSICMLLKCTIEEWNRARICSILKLVLTKADVKR